MLASSSGFPLLCIICIIGERERANPCGQLGTFFRLYICDDPRSQKYGHVIRASKIREMENVSIVQYTGSVQLRIAVIIGIAIDTDPGWNGVSTLAAREANRARETPEEGEDHLARQRARRRGGTRQRLPSREKRPSLLIELTGDDGLRRKVPCCKRYASLGAALEVLSKLLRSARPVVPDKEALCNGEER